MQVVLISPYEIGRQPFALAEPAALLRDVGCNVECLDLSLQGLAPASIAKADLIGIYISMHTATRIAFEAIPRIRQCAPRAHLCVYGLYAPVNEAHLRALGVDTVLDGEFEPALLALVERLRSGDGDLGTGPSSALPRVPFAVPDRSVLPPLSRYARLIMPDGKRKIVGFAETSRGCKHFCRHCPVVPVYEGRFRIVPRDVVAADIRNQVEAGAEHISFGDPDFLNGPGHARKVVRALHAEFPDVSYDATVKIEHILRHRDLLPELKATGCLFITSAAESVDDRVLDLLDKGHTKADFVEAVCILRAAGITPAPTFVAFTPWTSIDGYIDLLRHVADLRLVESVPPVQLSIRLLVPRGSYLLKLPEFRTRLGEFDADTLGYPWVHADPRVDALQRSVQECAMQAEQHEWSRSKTFTEIWRLAHSAAGRSASVAVSSISEGPVPRLSEPWYCCAEPTSQQLVSF